jgi:hypothetical protein
MSVFFRRYGGKEIRRYDKCVVFGIYSPLRAERGWG